VIHTHVQLYNANGRQANGEVLQEIETALRQETKPNVPVMRSGASPESRPAAGSEVSNVR
jgi:hypothetical protein